MQMVYSKLRNHQGGVERRLALEWDRWGFEAGLYAYLLITLRKSLQFSGWFLWSVNQIYQQPHLSYCQDQIIAVKCPAHCLDQIGLTKCHSPLPHGALLAQRMVRIQNSSVQPISTKEERGFSQRLGLGSSRLTLEPSTQVPRLVVPAPCYLLLALWC